MRNNAPILDLELIPYNMWLHLYSDKKKFREAINAVCPSEKQHTHEKELSGVDGMCFRHPDKPGNIFMGVFTSELDVLAHELIHVLDIVIEHAGLPHGFENGEPRAHLMGYMFSQCLKALNRRTKR